MISRFFNIGRTANGIKLKEKFRPPPCKVQFTDTGRHVFGGPVVHKGAAPRKSDVPMHLLMLLDTADELVPIKADKGSLPTRLPLYYPLRYGFGGGEAQYEVIDDQHIRIIHIVDEKPDNEVYPFMEAFPQRRFSLEPFTYEQYRAFVMRDMKLSEEDWRIVKEEVAPWHLIQFGGSISAIQGSIQWRCRNKGCQWNRIDARVDPFCRVSATPTEDIEIFGEYGTDVEIYFGLCRMCGTIITVNRCT